MPDEEAGWLCYWDVARARLEHRFGDPGKVTEADRESLARAIQKAVSRWFEAKGVFEPHVVWRGSVTDLATDLRSLLLEEMQHSLGFELLRGVSFEREPVEMLLWCPECSERHIDTGEFATKPHHTHACQSCGHVWRPAIVRTVGVQFLPGFKNG